MLTFIAVHFLKVLVSPSVVLSFVLLSLYIHVCAGVRVQVWVYVCAYVCMYVCTQTHMYNGQYEELHLGLSLAFILC